MRRVIIIALLFVFPIITDAQPGGFRPDMMSDEELIQMQTADLAMWLNLAGGAKDKFIKEYTAFRKEIAEVARTAFPSERTDSEDEIEKGLLNNFEVSEKILELRRKYYQIFRKFMKPSQIRFMYHLENESGKRMHDRPGRPSRPDGPDGPGMPPMQPHPMGDRPMGAGTGMMQ